MINTNKLKGKIVEQGLTFGLLAKRIGMSPSTLGRKIRNISDMNLEEVELIREILHIPATQIMDYFFTDGN